LSTSSADIKEISTADFPPSVATEFKSVARLWRNLAVCVEIKFSVFLEDIQEFNIYGQQQSERAGNRRFITCL
jgi:hypothetical protein